MSPLGEKQSPEAFLSWLKTQIPLINHMGFLPLEWDGQALKMRAQLAPNVNDKGTGFGGSLATVATLCGWSTVTLFLREQGRDDDVVIRDSHIEYLLPVTADFTAQTALPEPSIRQAFKQKMDSKGRVRIDLVIEVIQQDQVALRLSAAYVALAKTR